MDTMQPKIPLGTLVVTFEQLITLLRQYITDNDFMMAGKVANLIAEECNRLDRQHSKIL